MCLEMVCVYIYIYIVQQLCALQMANRIFFGLLNSQTHQLLFLLMKEYFLVPGFLVFDIYRLIG